MTVQRNHSISHVGPLGDLQTLDFTGTQGKHFAGKELGLTGCEVSFNCLPRGKGIPYIHAHRQNEELYYILRGSGTFHIDGDEFPVQQGSVIRVAPAGARSLKAGDEDLHYICVQARAGSLEQATREDGFKVEAKASWM